MRLGAKATPQFLPQVNNGTLKLIKETNYLVRLIHGNAEKGLRFV